MILPEVEPRRNGEMSNEKRGGTGPAAKQTPDPRQTHSPQPKVKVLL